MFLLDLKKDLKVAVFPVIYSLFVCLACTCYLHVGDDKDMIRKMQKSWVTTKCMEGFGCQALAKAILMRRYTKAVHQQLLQLVMII